MLRAVEDDAEEDAQPRAEDAEEQRLRAAEGRHLGDIRDLVGGEGEAQAPGHIARRERCDDRRDERGILHRPDRTDLHREDSGRHRRAEDRGKCRAHAAEDERAAVLVAQMDAASQEVGERAAELERRALASGTAAHEMGQDGADKDERRHLHGQLSLGAERGDDHVRAAVVLVVGDAVEPDDEQAGRQHEQIAPAMAAAEGRPDGDALHERRPDHAEHRSQQDRQRDPPHQEPQVQQRMHGIVHHLSAPVVQPLAATVTQDLEKTQNVPSPILPSSGSAAAPSCQKTAGRRRYRYPYCTMFCEGCQEGGRAPFRFPRYDAVYCLGRLVSIFLRCRIVKGLAVHP